MSKSFSDILKTITFARMLVSNLFGKPSESRISLRMSRLVFKHLLSNFAVLFKLLLSKLLLQMHFHKIGSYGLNIIVHLTRCKCKFYTYRNYSRNNNSKCIICQKLDKIISRELGWRKFGAGEHYINQRQKRKTKKIDGF